MHTFISMLRGINVGGQKQIRMPVLKALYESIGFTDVETSIQSGNVIFRSPRNTPSAFVNAIEGAIEGSFGYTVTVIIRRPSEMESIIRTCPFIGRGIADTSRLYVTFLHAEPSPSHVTSLHALPKTPGDEFILSGRVVYVHCPNGYGKTQLSNTFFEKHLKAAATTRNWKTVNTLLTMSTRPASLHH